MQNNQIDSFFGKYQFLSNFWPVPKGIYFEGHTYPTVEHAYQAAKTLDESEREQIRTQKSPGKAKGMGSRLTLREDWNDVRLDVMERLVYMKAKDPDFSQLLRNTGDAKLIEGNTRGDRFWGVCDGIGENHLGRILMEVRSALNGGM